MAACGGEEPSASEDEALSARCAFGSSVANVGASGAIQVGRDSPLTRATKLSAISERQLIAGFEGRASTKDDAFRIVDGGRVTLRSLTEMTSGRKFYEYRFTLAGKEQGFVFEASKAERPVARIDGGRFAQCSVRPSKVKAATHCLFGLTTDDLFASPDVTIADPVTLKVDSALTDVQKAQILAGTKASTLEDAFKVPDGGELDLYRVVDKRAGRAFTMYGYSGGGGDPFAFIFAEQGTSLAARIEQDVVQGCVVER